MFKKTKLVISLEIALIRKIKRVSFLIMTEKLVLD